MGNLSSFILIFERDYQLALLVTYVINSHCEKHTHTKLSGFHESVKRIHEPKIVNNHRRKGTLVVQPDIYYDRKLT